MTDTESDIDTNLARVECGDGAWPKPRAPSVLVCAGATFGRKCRLSPAFFEKLAKCASIESLRLEKQWDLPT